MKEKYKKKNQPILVLNIRGLVQAGENIFAPIKGSAMQNLRIIKDAWLLVADGKIEGYGKMSELDEVIPDKQGSTLIDATSRFVFPSFCDSHTHLVFAGSREKEFVHKIKGLSYEEIAKKGGGILNSARRLRKTSENELYEQAYIRIREIIRSGTGAVEIKSGYGLNLKDELKMLRVIRRLKENSPLQVKATFLGAHALPEEYSGNMEGYVNYVINEMIPAVASEELADYIDVFCDRGFFTTGDTERILMAGIKYGLKPRLHANQLDNSGGVQAGVKYNALSVDHLECIGNEEIQCLLGSETIPTLLPGAAFFLRSNYPPARKLIDAGLPVALASDYNPGSCPSGNMKLVISLACILLKMLPEEAVNGATINGACAMGLEDSVGSISKGKIANIFITKQISSIDYFPYAFGSDLIDKVMLNGMMVLKGG